MKIKSLDSIGNLKDKKVLLRLDLNVPVSGGKVSDDYRIKKILPTIEFLSHSGARVILISHMGSGKKEESLFPVSEYLSSRFKVSFLTELVGPALLERAEKVAEGEIILLENLRHYDGEEKNDSRFAEELASLADVYVNEAFSVSHRPHSSIVGLPALLPSYAGFLFMEEFRNLSLTFNPKHPFLFILGGAKFETKLPLVRKFLSLADKVFIGGALANDLYKAKGFNVGVSLVSDGINLSDILASEKVILPADVLVMNESGPAEKFPNKVENGDKIVDAGKGAVGELERLISESSFILWNGPLGNYERGYGQATETLARAIAESGTYSVIGGGDTIASIKDRSLFEKFGFVSTAGGAMLEFLATGTLPGIEALKAGVGK